MKVSPTNSATSGASYHHAFHSVSFCALHLSHMSSGSSAPAGLVRVEVARLVLVGSCSTRVRFGTRTFNFKPHLCRCSKDPMTSLGRVSPVVPSPLFSSISVQGSLVKGRWYLTKVAKIHLSDGLSYLPGLTFSKETKELLKKWISYSYTDGARDRR